MTLRHLSFLSLLLAGLMSSPVLPAAPAQSELKPVFAESVLPDADFQVGTWGEARPQLISDPAGVTFKASGLPAGLLCNPQTGVISGFPQKPGAKKIQIVATHSSKATTTAKATLTVHAFPEALTGDFQALIPALGADGSPESWGGLLTLNVAAHGTFSGKLVSGDQTRSFKGVLKSQDDSGYAATLHLTTSLHLQIQENDAGVFVGSLRDNTTSTEVTFTTSARAWSKKTPALWAKGAYTMRLIAAANSPATAPCGDGYLLATVNADGTTLLKGALADGTPVTASGLLLKHEAASNQILLHQPLYAAKAPGSKVKTPFGAFRGALILSVATPEDLTLNPAPGARFTSAEWLSWKKIPSGLPGEMLYPEGFDLELDVEGYRYLKPGKNVLLLQASPGKRNAMLQMFRLGATPYTIPLIEHSFTLTTAHQVQPYSNPQSGLFGFKLSINASTGLFSGSFHNGDAGNDRQSGKFAGVLLTVEDSTNASGHVVWTTMTSPDYPRSAHSYLMTLETREPESPGPGPGIPSGGAPGAGLGGGIAGPIGQPNTNTTAPRNGSIQQTNGPAPLTGGIPGSANVGTSGYGGGFTTPIQTTGGSYGASVTISAGGSSYTGTPLSGSVDIAPNYWPTGQGSGLGWGGTTTGILP